MYTVRTLKNVPYLTDYLIELNIWFDELCSGYKSIRQGVRQEEWKALDISSFFFLFCLCRVSIPLCTEYPVPPLSHSRPFPTSVSWFTHRDKLIMRVTFQDDYSRRISLFSILYGVWLFSVCIRVTSVCVCLEQPLIRVNRRDVELLFLYTVRMYLHCMYTPKRMDRIEGIWRLNGA